MTEELLAVGRRWCQMWGSTRIGCGAFNPLEASVNVAVSFHWVLISARLGACQQRAPPFCYCITSAEAVRTCLPPCDYLLVKRSPWGHKQRRPQLARMSELFMGQTVALLASSPLSLRTARAELGESDFFFLLLHSSLAPAGDQAFVTQSGGWDLYHICGCPHFIYYILKGPRP